MVSSSIEDRRRKRAQQFGEDANSGASALFAGVADIEKKTRADQDRMTALAKAKAEAERAANAENRAQSRFEGEKTSDAAALAAKNVETEARRAELERKATADKRAELERKRAESAKQLGIDMAGTTVEFSPENDTRNSLDRMRDSGGVWWSDIEKRAADVGQDPKALLAAADALEQKRIADQEALAEKSRKTQSEIDKNDALAKKAARVPTGKSGNDEKKQLEIDILKGRKKVLDRQGAANDLNAPTPDTVNKAQARRQVLGEAKRLNQSIRALADRYPNIESYVGRLDGPVGDLAAWLNISSEDAANIRSTIKRAFNEYKTLITGAAASDKEMAALEATVPNMNKSWQQILGDLDAGDAIIDEKNKGIDAVLSTKDTRAFDPAFRAASPASSPSSGARPTGAQVVDD